MRYYSPLCHQIKLISDNHRWTVQSHQPQLGRKIFPSSAMQRTLVCLTQKVVWNLVPLGFKLLVKNSLAYLTNIRIDIGKNHFNE